MKRFLSRGMARRGSWPWLALVCLAILLAGCAKSAPPRAGAPAVEVAAAKAVDMPIEERTIGTVAPIESVTIRAQVGGYLRQVLFKEGDEVAAGQTLFQLDARTFDAQVKSGAATLEQTRTQLANAENQLRRGEELFKQKMISAEALDDLRTAAASLRSALAAQAASLERARLDRQFAVIRAPFTGRIGRRLANAGDLVQANNTALATLNQTRPIDVQFAVPEKDLAMVRRAMAEGETPARVSAGGTDEVMTGALVFIDNAVDDRTGSVLLKARFDNADERLWPGQFVDVTVRLGVRAGAIVVPSSALQTGQLGEYVYVLDAERKAAVRKVRSGPTRDGLTIIEEGVAAGEAVVTDGQLRLAPGVKAEVRGGEPVAPPGQPAPEKTQ
jgi:multidrug efflux system membrane fusion protein